MTLTSVLVLSVSVLVAVAGLLWLVLVGVREGDKPDDALLVDVEPYSAAPGVSATVTNPGTRPVIVGISLRRPSLRIRLEAGIYVRIETGRTTGEVLPGHQAVMGAVPSGQSATFVVTAGPDLRRTAELVAVVGQRARLRTIHRLIQLPEPAPRPRLREPAWREHAPPRAAMSE